MEKTIGELCEILSLQRKRIKRLSEDPNVQEYINACKMAEEVLSEVKPIIKTAKKSYEDENIVLTYQQRMKRLKEFNVPLVKEQSWAKYVIEERVKEDIFDSLVEASKDLTGVELDSVIHNPESFYSVKEVDVSAVLVKDK
jgi:Zn-dependent oligopeptidase